MSKVGESRKGEPRLSPQQQKFLDNYLHKDLTQTASVQERKCISRTDSQQSENKRADGRDANGAGK